jgi:hypothetical protein
MAGIGKMVPGWISLRDGSQPLLPCPGFSKNNVKRHTTLKIDRQPAFPCLILSRGRRRGVGRATGTMKPLDCESTQPQRAVSDSARRRHRLICRFAQGCCVGTATRGPGQPVRVTSGWLRPSTAWSNKVSWPETMEAASIVHRDCTDNSAPQQLALAHLLLLDTRCWSPRRSAPASELQV